MAFAALSVSAGLARSPFVLSDAVPAECMSMEKVDMPMMNRAISKPASALKFDFVKENRKHLMKKECTDCSIDSTGSSTCNECIGCRICSELEHGFRGELLFGTNLQAFYDYARC